MAQQWTVLLMQPWVCCTGRTGNSTISIWSNQRLTLCFQCLLALFVHVRKSNKSKLWQQRHGVFHAFSLLQKQHDNCEDQADHFLRSKCSNENEGYWWSTCMRLHNVHVCGEFVVWLCLVDNVGVVWRCVWVLPTDLDVNQHQSLWNCPMVSIQGGAHNVKPREMFLVTISVLWPVPSVCRQSAILSAYLDASRREL